MDIESQLNRAWNEKLESISRENEDIPYMELACSLEEEDES